MEKVGQIAIDTADLPLLYSAQLRQQDATGTLFKSPSLFWLMFI